MRQTGKSPAEPSRRRESSSDTGKKFEWLQWLLTIVTALLFIGATAALFLYPKPEIMNWSSGVLLVFTALSTIVMLTRQLPLQNVLLAAAGITLIGSIADFASVKTAIPFGPFIYGENAGAKLFDSFPWMIPFLWVAVVFSSRGVARLILRPWRKTKTYGFRLIGLTVILTALFDLVMDPFASAVAHFWFWTPTMFPVKWFGAPVINFFSWLAVPLLMLAVITPALIRKQPGQSSSKDFQALIAWLGALIFFGAALALHGLWIAVVVDAVVAVVAAIFAIAGSRW